MVVRAVDIEKSFQGPTGPVPVLQGVSLTLDAGASLALTGESGSGKSTFLHIAGALETADAGQLTVAGQDLMGAADRTRATLRRTQLGVVFQQFNLIPSLNVEANIAFQARLAGRHDPKWAATLTQALGLDGLQNRYPEALSGGQQQRVAIARALAPRPALVLADEPTGNLDESTADQVMALFLQALTETGAALLMVTHSPRLAARLDAQAHLQGGRLR